MFNVTIYIETSLKSPRVADGSYAAIVEFVKKTGTPALRIVSGKEEESTYNRLKIKTCGSSSRRRQRHTKSQSQREQIGDTKES